MNSNKTRNTRTIITRHLEATTYELSCTLKHVLGALNTYVSLDNILNTNKQNIYIIYTINFNKQMNKHKKWKIVAGHVHTGW